MAINTGRTDDCVLALLLLEKRAESDPDLAAWIEAELATAIPAPHSTTAGRRRNPSRPCEAVQTVGDQFGHGAHDETLMRLAIVAHASHSEWVIQSGDASGQQHHGREPGRVSRADGAMAGRGCARHCAVGSRESRGLTIDRPRDIAQEPNY